MGCIEFGVGCGKLHLSLYKQKAGGLLCFCGYSTVRDAPFFFGKTSSSQAVNLMLCCISSYVARHRPILDVPTLRTRRSVSSPLAPRRFRRFSWTPPVSLCVQTRPLLCVHSCACNAVKCCCVRPTVKTKRVQRVALRWSWRLRIAVLRLWVRCARRQSEGEGGMSSSTTFLVTAIFDVVVNVTILVGASWMTSLFLMLGDSRRRCRHEWFRTAAAAVDADHHHLALQVV